ncbi:MULTISPECIES: DUF3718 domain-containing protein [Rheinheimera]|jgi:hypothetical protein|uniref:DUF3718 domain-containing protein n=1 Tax=Rheinheimera aquimaris TaxID=412437 RepID=A0ABN1DBR9_9GAMM|nr:MULTISPECIES: DUF3718 domain-containing protein [Rheinheimera]MCB5212448.1 DUF3718 domain-containing protein [Rheinheimera aquimaris]MCD1599107.1 DUF3718 domain-containing protein [Rheinheimera aquimaris]|tara:strand:- start:173 stop:532 length:360 start_codon:yes stop_codon:yes gene_type:complete
MKKLLVSFIALTLSHTVCANDDQLAASMCGYLKEDNRNQLRKMLTDNKINVRNIYDGVKCNNENMLQFAIRNDAYESGTFIVKQMPSKTLAEFDYVGWAKSNGFEASPLVNEIRTRIGE